MALRSVADLVLRMQKVEKAVGPQGQRDYMTAVGVALKSPALTAAASTKLGADLMFTAGWSRAGPLQVAFTVHRDGNGLTMHRRGRSAGPWRVAESGRNQGSASGFSGPGINVKTGTTARNKDGSMRKVRARKARRWNGTTAGFGAWSKAEASMAAAAPELLQKLERKGVIDAFLGK